MRSVLLLPFLFLLGSCGNLQNLAIKARAKRQQQAMEKLAKTSSEEADARLGATALGEVALVHEGEQYVLIRALTGVALPADAGLETRRDGKPTALLRSTTERKGNFAAADLLEGMPLPGDGVFASSRKPKSRPPVRQVAMPTPAPSLPSAPTAKPGVVPVAPAPGLPSPEPKPAAPPAVDDGFDPTNLPAFTEPVVAPQDLQNR
jgi:hypothetical protein